ELRNDQRLITPALCIAVLREGPIRSGSELLGELFPLGAPLGYGAVVVVVVEIGLDVEVGDAWGVVDDQPAWSSGLQPVIGPFQPAPMVGILHQPAAPVLIDQVPPDERGVVAVASEDALPGFPHALGR